MTATEPTVPATSGGVAGFDLTPLRLFLPYGNGVHYDTDPGRRPLVHRLVIEGTLPLSHCTDDGVGLVYRGTELVDTVTETPGRGGVRRPARGGPGGRGTRGTAPAPGTAALTLPTAPQGPHPNSPAALRC